MSLVPRPLNDDDIRAICDMPEFQKALKRIKKLHRKADKARAREEAAANARIIHCEGAAPIAEGHILRCPKCDLTLVHDAPSGNLYMNHLSLMRGEHWNRLDQPGANPFTESGLSGKAAMAAAGDWYGSH